MKAKKQIFKLLDKNGTIQTDRGKILNIAKEFYEDLYTSVQPKFQTEAKNSSRPVIMNVGSEEIPDGRRNNGFNG